MEKKNRIWLLYLLAFVIVAGYTVFIPILPFLIESLGGGSSQVGLVIALAPLTTVLFSPLLGTLADRWGRKPIILLGLAGMAIWFGLYALATSMTFLYIGSLIGGIFSAGAMAAATAYISDVTTEEERGGFITKLQAAQMVGAFLPPLASGFLATVSLSLPFYILAGLSFIPLILSIFLLPESLSQQQQQKTVAEEESAVKVVLASYGKLFGYLKTSIGPLLIIAFLVAFPTGFFETSLPLLITSMGLTTSQSGIIFSVGTFAVLIAQIVFVERAMKKFGEFANIIVGMIAAAVFYLILPLSSGFWIILIVNAVLSLTTSQMRPANITLLTKYAPVEEQGLSQSFYNLYTSIGRIIGPILGGIVYGSLGGFVALAIAAAIFVLSALYTARVQKKYKTASPD